MLSRRKKLEPDSKNEHNAGMKYILISLLFFTACSSSTNKVKHTIIVKGSSSSSLAAGDDPSSLTLTVLELYAGKEADCSDLAIVRRHGTSGKAFEMINSAETEIISARPATDATYQCIAVKISDQVRFFPNAQAITNHAACVSQEDAFIFDAYTTATTGQPFYDLSGNAIAPAGNPGATSQEYMYLIFSVGVPSFTTSANQRFSMSSGLNTDSPYDVFLYAEFAGTVTDSGGNCYLSGDHIGLR